MFYSSQSGGCDTKRVEFHLLRNLNIFGYRTDRQTAPASVEGFLFLFLFIFLMVEMDRGPSSSKAKQAHMLTPNPVF